MKLYTIVNDRKKWKNSLRSENLSLIDYPEELVEGFREVAKGYIIYCRCEWTVDTDYGEENDYSSSYRSIQDGQFLICDGRIVGVVFCTEHYTHAMSNVKSYEYNAMYFDKPNEKKGERWYEGCELYYNTPNSDTSYDLKLLARENVSQSVNIEPFTLTNLLN